jgi:hypothetical protein
MRACFLFVRRFSVAQLAAANHEHELSPEPVLHVHCDGAHCGLGGDDSWTRSVHAQHLLHPRGAAAPFEITLLVAHLPRGADADAAYRALAAAPEL